MRQKRIMPRVCPQCGKEFTPETERKFCSLSCRSTYINLHRPKKRDGCVLSSRGYVMILNPNYPHDGRPQYIQEHRIVMEAHLNRPLLPAPYEVVHHKDGNKRNNDISNLELKTQSEHMRLHVKIDRWARDHDCCVKCGTTERKHMGHGLCRRCATRKRKGIVHFSPRVTGAWATKYERCVECGTTERRHICHGLCSLCYERSRNRVWTKARSEQQRSDSVA